MVQALYSRSSKSVREHLQRVQEVGSGKFVNSYVVNYNHKSIADCASVTICFEGVSVLAAKAIEDWALYCGQETSTRYVDMTKAGIVDPENTSASNKIMQRWKQFYLEGLEPVANEISRRYPQKDEEEDADYKRAVKARTFDVMRAFLPAGIQTQLSWHTNLRQAGDHLEWLRYHPLEEVRSLAEQALTMLADKYPNSGFGRSQAAVSGVSEGEQDRRKWMEAAALNFTYGYGRVQKSFRHDLKNIKNYPTLLTYRPRGAVLPHFLTDLGQVHLDFNLDYGSFRDVQRHRNGVCRRPCLTTEVGFHPWYLEQLPKSMVDDAKWLLAQQELAIAELPIGADCRQYYIAMGYQVGCQLTYGLPATLYILELRSSKTVHHTLRQVSLEATKWFKEEFPHIALHVDDSPDDWTLRRGQQTIEERQ